MQNLGYTFASFGQQNKQSSTLSSRNINLTSQVAVCHLGWRSSRMYVELYLLLINTSRYNRIFQKKNKGRAAKQRLTWRCSYVSRSSVRLIYDNPRTMVKKSDHRKRSCKSVGFFCGFYSGRYAPLPFNRSLQQLSFLILQEGGNKLTSLRIVGNRNWIRIQFYSHISHHRSKNSLCSTRISDWPVSRIVSYISE